MNKALNTIIMMSSFIVSILFVVGAEIGFRSSATLYNSFIVGAKNFSKDFGEVK
jgi:hypothetical protein